MKSVTIAAWLERKQEDDIRESAKCGFAIWMDLW